MDEDLAVIVLLFTHGSMLRAGTCGIRCIAWGVLLQGYQSYKHHLVQRRNKIYLAFCSRA